MNLKEKDFAYSSKQQLFPGLWVYKNVFKPEFQIIERLEKAIEDSKGQYNWKQAMVGYDERIKDYRDCVDFKINNVQREVTDIYQAEFDSIWQDSYNAQLPAVNDYCNYHIIKMDFWEAMNFIRYGEGQHFQEHADHGFSYTATVSLVGYPNDDYEEGGLYFPKLGIHIKPEAGDLYIFPSTYIYSHRAMPVKSGTKYSIVTMLDYNDNAHNPEYEELVAKRNANV